MPCFFLASSASTELVALTFLTLDSASAVGPDYRFHAEEKNWDAAEATCVAAGGRLAAPDRKVDRDYILSRFSHRLNFWIGASVDLGAGSQRLKRNLEHDDDDDDG